MDERAALNNDEKRRGKSVLLQVSFGYFCYYNLDQSVRISNRYNTRIFYLKCVNDGIDASINDYEMFIKFIGATKPDFFV